MNVIKPQGKYSDIWQQSCMLVDQPKKWGTNVSEITNNIRYLIAAHEFLRSGMTAINNFVFVVVLFCFQMKLSFLKYIIPVYDKYNSSSIKSFMRFLFLMPYDKSSQVYTIARYLLSAKPLYKSKKDKQYISWYMASQDYITVRYRSARGDPPI